MEKTFVGKNDRGQFKNFVWVKLMDYKKIYNDFISSRKSLSRKRNDGVYYERHHILPTSLGGNNDKSNLVLLTPKEHYFAHLLLTNCFDNTKEKKKMIFAFWNMVNDTRQNRNFNSREYEKARIAISNVMKLENCKPVSQFSLKGEWIKDFNSIKEAMNETGILSITGYLKGKISHSGKYLWKYKEGSTNEQNQKFNDKVNGLIKKKECSVETRKKLSDKMLGDKNPMKNKSVVNKKMLSQKDNYICKKI